MSNYTISIIAIGLAMDAFAVSISEGVAIKRMKIRFAILVAMLFGLFQAFMPLLGYLAGSFFYDLINKYSHFVSFILLVVIGIKMIYEGYEEEKCEREGRCQISGNHFLLALATSIDALAIGFSFSFVKDIDIFLTVVIIGCITFLISFGGVYIGNKIGRFMNTKVELFGGVILIIMGIKSLITYYI